VSRKLPGVSPASITRFLSQARRIAGINGRVNVLLTSDYELRRLNRMYRGKDEATDVLSFPASPHMAAEFAGDIAISVQYATRSARRFGHSPGEELRILLLHGLLHLAGYDHERDNGRMGRKEDRLRRRLGLPVSLIARSSSRDTRRRPQKEQHA